MPSKRAYSYIRFSTEEQMKGSSLERQDALLKQFLAHNPDYELIEDSYKDLGVSGYTGKHKNAGDLGRFLAACENGTVRKGSYLLVESIDRLGRLSGVDFLTLILQLFEYVSIVTLEDNQVYNPATFDGHAAFSLHAKIQQAHNYSKQLSSRLLKARENTRRKVRAGELNKIAKTCPAWLKWSDDDNAFIPIPERVNVVEKIFNLYTLDALGTTAIASYLNKNGVESFGGKGWHGSYITKILFDRKVIGEMRGRSNEVLEDYYPQVIPIEKFLSASEQKKVRSKKFRVRDFENKPPLDIYADVVRCKCGQSAKLYNKGANRFIYQCKNRVRGVCKQSDGLNKTDLIKHYGEYLDAYIKIYLYQSKKEREACDDIVNLRDDKTRLEELETLLRRKLKNFRGMLASAVDDKEAGEINIEIEDIRSQLSDVKLQLKSIEENQLAFRFRAQFNVDDVYASNLDWATFIKGESKNYIKPNNAINLMKWFDQIGLQITLQSDFSSSLSLYNDPDVISCKKLHRSSKGSVSTLRDGDAYITVREDQSIKYGKGFDKLANQHFDEYPEAYVDFTRQIEV